MDNFKYLIFKRFSWTFYNEEQRLATLHSVYCQVDWKYQFNNQYQQLLYNGLLYPYKWIT